MTFREYYHNGEFSHTIPRYVGTTERIVSFLNLHNKATEEDIAKTLNLELDDVSRILLDLEKDGSVERIPLQLAENK